MSVAYFYQPLKWNVQYRLKPQIQCYGNVKVCCDSQLLLKFTLISVFIMSISRSKNPCGKTGLSSTVRQLILLYVCVQFTYGLFCLYNNQTRTQGDTESPSDMRFLLHTFILNKIFTYNVFHITAFEVIFICCLFRAPKDLQNSTKILQKMIKQTRTQAV